MLVRENKIGKVTEKINNLGVVGFCHFRLEDINSFKLKGTVAEAYIMQHYSTVLLDRKIKRLKSSQGAVDSKRA